MIHLKCLVQLSQSLSVGLLFQTHETTLYHAAIGSSKLLLVKMQCCLNTIEL